MTMTIVNELDTDITRALEQALRNADGKSRCYTRIDGRDKVTCINKGEDDGRENLWWLYVCDQIKEYFKCSFTIADGVITFFMPKPLLKEKIKEGKELIKKASKRTKKVD